MSPALFFVAALLASSPPARLQAAAPLDAAGSDEISVRHLRRAEELLGRKLFAEAAMAADQAIEAAPRNPKAYNFKATALNRLGRFKEAVEVSKVSISLEDSRNSAAYDNLAWAELHLKRYRDAVQSAGRAIAMNPEDAQAYAIRAYALEVLGRPDMTLEDIRAAARLAPASFSRHLELAERGRKIFRPAGIDWVSYLVMAGILLLAGGAALLIWKKTEPVKKVRKKAESVDLEPEGGLLAGKYKLVRVIGHGGMGQVWEGTDVSLGRTVALKKMSTDLGDMGSTVREYYMKEARTVASLHHPHIISIYEILDLKSGLYLVFEMASGKTVQHLLAECRRMDVSQIRDILKPVCEALDFAHSRGVVHRDLKPSNIMLTSQGFVKVMDFGIARKIDETLNPPGASRDGPKRDARGILTDHTQTIVGTPIYMSPEAENGLVTPVSDVFSLGICLYEMLTGRMPYDPRAGIGAKLDRRYIKVAQHSPGLSPALDALVYDALDPNPEKRIASVREFSDRLTDIIPS